MTIITSIFWCFYLSLGPVYWLPNMSVEVLALIKATLIAAAIIFSIILAITKNKLKLPGGIYGIFGYITIILFSSTGFIQTESSDVALKMFLDITYGFVTMWAFYLFYISSNGKTLPFIFSSIAISIFSALVVTSQYFNFPAWTPPRIFANYSLSTAGFGALRTGWSNGISFFTVGITFIAIGKKNKLTNKRYFLTGAIAILIIGSQIVVGGRAGLLASLIGLLVVFWKVSPKASKIIMPIFIVTLVIGMIIKGNLEEHLRLDRLDKIEKSSSTLKTLDHFSAGRITTYMYALDKWLESPIIGHGFGQVDVIYGHEIHNLWLRLLAEAGPLLPLTYLTGILVFFNRITKVFSRFDSMQSEKIKMMLSASIVLQGVMISFLEPRMLLGSFQNCAIWWVAFGAGLGTMELYKKTSYETK